VTPGRGKRRSLLALCLLGSLLFAGLGVWQLQRLDWKRDLIRHVEERIDAAPVAAPPRRDWASLDMADAVYRRVQARGVFLHQHETLVDALTQLGPGSWVLTPLRTEDGTVLVNRGFVPPALEDPATRIAAQPTGEVMVTGLLRATEPEGRMLRPNEPAADRWFSRDIAAIGTARGLNDVAPFFIDADAASGIEGGPRGGMTVVRFRNAHLAYAATWFALAILCGGGVVLLRRMRI
jgi:surfeit locus 1 family protein